MMHGQKNIKLSYKQFIKFLNVSLFTR